MKRLTKFIVLTFFFAVVAGLFSIAQAATGADLTVSSFVLEDSSGHAKTTFAPNESIYVKFTIKNQGTATAFNKYTTSGNIWTQVYKNKPSSVATSTQSDTYIWVRNSNNIKAGQSISYNSTASGINTAAFEGDNSWKMATPGTYTARVFVNFDGLANESSRSNNQIAITYTVTSNATPTPTKVPTPTPTKAPIATPTPTVPPVPGQPVIRGTVSPSCTNGSMKLVFPTGQTSSRWAVRLDNTKNGWGGDTPLAGDIVNNNVTAGTFTQSEERGYDIFWWVHLVSNEGIYSSAVGGTAHCELPAPTNLVSKCNLPDERMEFSWNAVPGAVSYAIRTDDEKNGFENPPLTGDTIKDNLTETSYNRHGFAGRHYNWWIHAIDRNGYYSKAASASCTRS
jgi:hypothetical protein